MPLVRILEEETVNYRFTKSPYLGVEVDLSEVDVQYIERMMGEYSELQRRLRWLFDIALSKEFS